MDTLTKDKDAKKPSLTFWLEILVLGVLVGALILWAFDVHPGFWTR